MNRAECYFASSIIWMIFSSTSRATPASPESFDSMPSIFSGLIVPIFVFPFSVYTDIRQGRAMLRLMSLDSTLAAWAAIADFEHVAFLGECDSLASQRVADVVHVKHAEAVALDRCLQILGS